MAVSRSRTDARRMLIAADRVALFREVDLFDGLSEEELVECKRTLPMFSADSGRLLVAPGREDQSLFIVKRGSVRLFRLSHDGRELTLGELGPGDVFGTLPMFGTISRNTYAEAASDALICRVDEPTLTQLLGRHPEIAVRLLAILGDRLASVEDQIEDLVFRRAEQRIARSVLHLAESGKRSKLTVSHEEIARRAGVARETVTKMLKDMERKGFVKTAYRSLKIVDLAAFERCAAD